VRAIARHREKEHEECQAVAADSRGHLRRLRAGTYVSVAVARHWCQMVSVACAVQMVHPAGASVPCGSS
jgi:hypothetical protein